MVEKNETNWSKESYLRLTQAANGNFLQASWAMISLARLFSFPSHHAKQHPKLFKDYIEEVIVERGLFSLNFCCLPRTNVFFVLFLFSSHSVFKEMISTFLKQHFVIFFFFLANTAKRFSVMRKTKGAESSEHTQSKLENVSRDETRLNENNKSNNLRHLIKCLKKHKSRINRHLHSITSSTVYFHHSL